MSSYTKDPYKIIMDVKEGVLMHDLFEGTVTAVDRDSKTVNISLSKPYYPRTDFTDFGKVQEIGYAAGGGSPVTELHNVPIIYNCQRENLNPANAFREGDGVMILAVNGQYYCVGFVDGIRPCGAYVLVRAGDLCFLWDIGTNNYAEVEGVSFPCHISELDAFLSNLEAIGRELLHGYTNYGSPNPCHWECIEWGPWCCSHVIYVPNVGCTYCCEGEEFCVNEHVTVPWNTWRCECNKDYTMRNSYLYEAVSYYYSGYMNRDITLWYEHHETGWRIATENPPSGWIGYCNEWYNFTYTKENRWWLKRFDEVLHEINPNSIEGSCSPGTSPCPLYPYGIDYAIYDYTGSGQAVGWDQPSDILQHRGRWCDFFSIEMLVHVYRIDDYYEYDEYVNNSWFDSCTMKNEYEVHAFCFYLEASDTPIQQIPPENAQRYTAMEEAVRDLYEAWRSTQGLEDTDTSQPNWQIEIYQ